MKSKAAKRKAAKAWRVKNRKRHKASIKAWRRLNPEKVKAEKRRWHARFYPKNREKLKAKSRKVYHKIKNTKKYIARQEENRFKRMYGITRAEVLAMFNKQRGRCAICGRKFKKLNVDHCHKTKKVRGLLCLRCNCGIGLFFDCVKNLSSAIKYLRRQRKI